MIIKVNNVNINYEVKGSGSKAMILIHGNGEDWRIFKSIDEYLGSDYTLYLVDSRGHGQSSNIETLTYEDMAADMGAFIKALNIEKPTIFGYSDGGNVALITAIGYPERVGDIIVAGANTSHEGLGDLLSDMKREYAETNNKYIGLMLSGPHITTKQLKSIQSKVYVLRGEHDLITKEHTLFFTKAIPNAQYIEIKDEDHGSYVADPKKLSTILLDIENKVN